MKTHLRWTRKQIGFTFLFAGIIFLFTALAVSASSPGQPGSVDDPVVTKSYVDEQLRQLKGQLGLGSGQPSSGASPAPGQNGTGGTGNIKVVALKAGQALIGFEGTELIVRTGKVTAIAGAQKDGLPDLTEGTNITEGKIVPPNHLILVPRSDGRGLRVAPGSPTAYIVVRGGYKIE
ncbi:hypothetical protein BSNK01_30500 [Bacillaceae bacterium]